MVYTRGSSSDFDRFAQVTGEPGWSWNRLLPYIYKVKTIGLRIHFVIYDEVEYRMKDG